MTTLHASSTNCVMCDLPAFQRGSDDHRRIADLEASTAILASREQFDLDQSLRQRFVEDANHIAQALNKTFLPLKMNYCLLGNTLRHLH